MNLNGPLQFRFDAEDAGLAANWAPGRHGLSPVDQRALPVGLRAVGRREVKPDIAWYRRSVRIPADWKGNRVFVVVGACDWLTMGWAGRPEDRQLSGRLHALRIRTDTLRQMGSGPGSRFAGRRHAPTRSNSRANKATAKPKVSGRRSIWKLGRTSHSKPCIFCPISMPKRSQSRPH